MSDKELWNLISIISEGQDSEQRRKVEQYITDLQKEIERLNNIRIALENERDVLKSTLSDTKADIKYLLTNGEGNGYIRNKYLRE